MTVLAPRHSHIFSRDADDWYIEPAWVTRRLLEEEDFPGPILDPACGWGTIINVAAELGYQVIGSDIAGRGAALASFRRLDFLAMQDREVLVWWRWASSVICNPPFASIEAFYHRAEDVMFTASGDRKIAFICPVRRLAAARWLTQTPLSKILFLTPRPSMPSGDHIQAGGKIGGGTQDFCWLIWCKSHVGPPSVAWLHRDG